MKDILFPKQEILDHVLVSLRRIVRSIDLYSKKLVQSHRLTIPQVVLLREIQRHERLALGELARLASLSNATVTGIIDRLESRELVRRVRSASDRRQVFVEILPNGANVLQTMFPLLQENFVRKLQELEKWEQAQILSSLERIASLMNAEEIEASPILAHHQLEASEDDIKGRKKALPRSVKIIPVNSGNTGIKKKSENDSIQQHIVHFVNSLDKFPDHIDINKLINFLHQNLKPYEDTPEDIERGIHDALSAIGREGGFLLISESQDGISGALVMQKTGMKGYVPENILLFVAVSPDQRGKGLGYNLIEYALSLVDGNVKLHVEYDNPARRLYERIGFTSKYAEMRYQKNEPNPH
ncbi:MAG: GNAT family N-acetyltransferase [Acidobacteriota bacterium]|jgi:ribosomal-protein-alanine N-acetyltransferase